MKSSCVFCDIVNKTAPAAILREWDDAVAFMPRGGVTDGHVLIVPRTHVADWIESPPVTGAVATRASELAQELDLTVGNLITSAGEEATQTVFHLHLHLLPRRRHDGLHLPWTPQHEAARNSGLRVVWAREEIPTLGPSVFLAGPTARLGTDTQSWRPDAIDELAAQWTGPGQLTVLTPESRGGKRAAHYDDQVGWETAARAAASSILFWIPRDLKEMPGFTTNVEFGLDVPTGRAVLGCPPDCPSPERNRYLIYVAHTFGTPVRETLRDTVTAALNVARRKEKGDSAQLRLTLESTRHDLRRARAQSTELEKQVRTLAVTTLGALPMPTGTSPADTGPGATTERTELSKADRAAEYCAGARCADCTPEDECCEATCGCCPRVNTQDWCWLRRGSEDDSKTCSQHGEGWLNDISPGRYT